MTENMIAPSILSADFANLEHALHLVEDSSDADYRADWIHVDVMDNHFVPNLTIGLPVVKALLPHAKAPIDCHLMIENPDKWAVQYAEAGAHNVTFHCEATENPVDVARKIRAAGAKAGLAIKPKTPVEDYLDILTEFDTVLILSVEPGFGGQEFMDEVIPKIRTLKQWIAEHKSNIMVEIDGGINKDTIGKAAQAGVDCFIAGSAIYNTPDPAAAIYSLRHIVDNNRAS